MYGTRKGRVIQDSYPIMVVGDAYTSQGAPTDQWEKARGKAEINTDPSVPTVTMGTRLKV